VPSFRSLAVMLLPPSSPPSPREFVTQGSDFAIWTPARCLPSSPTPTAQDEKTFMETHAHDAAMPYTYTWTRCINAEAWPPMYPLPNTVETLLSCSRDVHPPPPPTFLSIRSIQAHIHSFAACIPTTRASYPPLQRAPASGIDGKASDDAAY
jgi:hypothetical protein